MYFKIGVKGTVFFACHATQALLLQDLLSFAWNWNEDRKNLWHQKWPFSSLISFPALVHVFCLAHFKHTKLSERLILFRPRAKRHGQAWQRRGPNCFDDKSDDKSQLYKRRIGPVQSYALCGHLCHLQSVRNCKHCILHCILMRFYQLYLIRVSWKLLMFSFKCCITGCAPAVHTLHSSSQSTARCTWRCSSTVWSCHLVGWKRPVWTERSFGCKQSCKIITNKHNIHENTNKQNNIKN